VLIPALKSAGFSWLVSVASASGLSARRVGDAAGFEKAVSGADAVIEDPDVDVVVVATPHDSHATLAAQALRAGKHVFCEKPLALDMEELRHVENALAESESVLFVDFNRRWSEPVRRLREEFASGSGPLVVSYRVDAGHADPSHWYGDRRQGGRLLGEVCHFVDTCAAIVGADASEVLALGSGGGETLLTEDVVIALRYPDGSLASIAYTTGGDQRDGKERIEVFGRGLSASVVDFRAIALSGRRLSQARQDKGHSAAAAQFRKLLTSGRRDPSALASTRSTLLAGDRLRRG
jgi:predicted dehydrogenase